MEERGWMEEGHCCEEELEGNRNRDGWTLKGPHAEENFYGRPGTPEQKSPGESASGAGNLVTPSHADFLIKAARACAGHHPTGTGYPGCTRQSPIALQLILNLPC